MHKKSHSTKALRLFLFSILAFVWASTPAVAQRYFSYNHPNFSLFGTSNLWDALRTDFKLHHEATHPFINAEIGWFSKNQQYIDRTTLRAAPYLYYIREQLKKRNLPGELALLPIIESAYNPFALSNKGAAGLWQFMPDTARSYGLKHNSWYDGRRDIIESTRAALDHLTYLNKRFAGDWLLAIAAYNSGEGLVQAAIDRNRRLGKTTDFWSLALPAQTKQYVPRLMAIANVIQSPDKYAVQLSPIRNAPYFTEIDLDSSVNLSQAAKTANIDVAALHALNAGYKRNATEPAMPSKLLIPIKAINNFNLKAQQDEEQSETRFTKATINSRFENPELNISKKFRNMFNDDSSEQSSPHAFKAEDSKSYIVKVKHIQHEVAAGETLYKISKHYNISTKDISRWNHFDMQNRLTIGESLNLWVKV